MKKEELIKGKWYKSNTSDYGISYMKYSHHNGFCLFCTDNISNTKYSSEKNYWINNAMINALELLTDLTEIQQYLPDGHEDKVTPKFIKGKWYKSITTEYLINYMKYSHHDGNKVYHTEKIVFGEYYNKTEYWINSAMIEVLTLLTDLTEIQQYLPDGHEDKVKPASAILGAEATKGFLLPKSERYLATMKFFKQLQEPERGQAIENYDEKYSCNIPEIISHALSSGFNWNKSKQGGSYWENIYSSIIDKPIKEPEPVKEETMFKKGDYIVTLINDGWCGKVNYCSKQRIDHRCLHPEKDINDREDNDNITFIFSDKSQFRWRFATKEEGEEYERHGKPYNVTNLLSSSIPDKPTEYIAKVGDYVEVISTVNNYFQLGDIVECINPSHFKGKRGNIQFLLPTDYKALYMDTTLVSNTTSDLITRDLSILNGTIDMRSTANNYPLTPKEAYPNYSLPVPTNIILKTKSKSIKL